MIDFLFSVAKVIFGAFCLFYIANSMLKSVNPEKPIGWCLTVGAMTFLVMFLYRLLGQSVGTPSYTVLAFVVIMGGMSANFDESFAEFVGPAIKKARYFAIAGGFVGWLTYAERVAV